MKTIRQMTKKGDPIIRVQLPEVVINMMQASAKKAKRRPQDEFIKRLAATLQNEAQYSATIEKLLPELKTIYTV